MRNLKRVLSLALALVMVLGMMVITTSAADFADADEVTYTEAMDVMAALKVFQGDDNGNVNPKGVLTRKEAAVIVARIILGDDLADGLAPTKQIFDDVPLTAATEWYAAEVEYCNNIGMIVGHNGKFDPDGQLTGTAFAKLLLCAMGYDADAQGYVGDKWDTNINADALRAGLNIKGVALTAPLTREGAAQMLFQALDGNMVEYTTYFDKDTNAPVLAGPYEVTETTGFGFWTKEEPVLFMDEYFSDLAYVEGTVAMDATTVELKDVELADSFAFEVGRPAHAWTLKDKLATNVYFDDVLVDSIYVDAKTDFSDYNSKGVAIITNGYVADDDMPAIGAAVRLFDTNADGKADLALALEETVKVVTSKVVVKDIKVSGKTVTSVTVPGVVTGTADNVVGYENLLAKDVVLSVTMPTGITYLTAAESVAGQMTKRNIRTNTIIFEGAEYGQSELPGTDVVELFWSGNTNAKTDYVMWLDRAGNAIWDEKVVVIDPTMYAYVLDYKDEFNGYYGPNQYSFTNYVELLYIDGTTEWVEGANKYYELEAAVGNWVTYTVNKYDEYTLTLVNTEIDETVKIDGVTTALNQFRATEETIYLVKNGDTYTAYEGYENVPALVSAFADVVKTSDINSAVLNNNLVSLVYVDATVLYTTKDVVVYTLDKSDIWSWRTSKTVKGETIYTDWYQLPVLVDGEDDYLIMNYDPSVALDYGYYADVVVSIEDGVTIPTGYEIDASDRAYTTKIDAVDYATNAIEMDGKVWNAKNALIIEVYGDAVAATADTYDVIDLDDLKVGDTIVYIASGKYITELYVLPANEAPVVEPTYTVTLVDLVEGLNITADKTTDLKKGDVVTLTVAADAGNLIDQPYYVTVNNELLPAAANHKYTVTIAGNTTVELDGAATLINCIVNHWTNVDEAATATPEAGSGYVMPYGSTYSFKVKADDGFVITSVKANDTALTADANGVYSFVVTDNTYISVETEAQEFTVTFEYYNAEGALIVSNTQSTTIKAGETKNVVLGTVETEAYVVDEVRYDAGETFKLENITKDTEIEVTVVPFV